MSRARKSSQKGRTLSQEARLALGERVREAMRYGRKGVGELAAEAKKHPVTVSKWRKGRVGTDGLMQLAELTGVSFNWLKTGDGAMVEGEPPSGEGRGGNGLGGAGARPLSDTSDTPEKGLAGEVTVKQDHPGSRLEPIPPLSIHPDPAQRMATEHVYAQATADLADKRLKGVPLDYADIQFWYDEMLRGAKDDIQVALTKLRATLERHPQRG